jgi:hypothetical protein
MVLGALGWMCTLALPTELLGKEGEVMRPPGPAMEGWDPAME